MTTVDAEGAVAGVEVDPADAESGLADSAERLKQYTWSNLHSGDCRISDGNRLTFGSDGRGSWVCSTWTEHTHSGDKGHVTFWVYTRADTFLFKLGEFDGPRMNDGEGGPPPHYLWQSTFTFDANLFDAIGKVTGRYSC